MKFIDTDSSDLQDCPAAVDMDTGDIYINQDVWDQYTESEKQFILQHELGHYNQQTDSEEDSDLYALKQNFGKVKKSLKSSFSALEKAGVKSEKRIGSLWKNALTIDANNGNETARKELAKLNLEHFNQKSNKMRQKQGNVTFIGRPATQETETNRRQIAVRRGFCRADGDEENSENKSGKKHKANGITISGYYFSFTNLLLVSIALILIFKKN